MGLLELCEKYFNSTNLYEVLGITEKATEKDVKKAYHKLSLKVHPDRVGENEKLEATEKFKVLGSIHAILTDKNKRAIYDETKCVDDDDFNVIQDRDWTIYWRTLFKPVTEDDIRAYEKKYVGSEEERQELKAAYLNGKGNMDYICDHVQFARTDQEERLREILNEMIKNGEIPSYKAFTHESAKKKQRRKAKELREEKEAEEWRKELGISDENGLKLMIKRNQLDREAEMNSFLNNLEAKYSKPKATKRKTASKSGPNAKNRKQSSAD